MYSMKNEDRIAKIIEKLSQMRFEKPTHLNEETIDDILLKVAEINNNLIELLVAFYKK
jgi:hypothetical protein